MTRCPSTSAFSLTDWCVKGYRCASVSRISTALRLFDFLKVLPVNGPVGLQVSTLVILCSTWRHKKLHFSQHNDDKINLNFVIRTYKNVILHLLKLQVLLLGYVSRRPILIYTIYSTPGSESWWSLKPNFLYRTSIYNEQGVNKLNSTTQTHPVVPVLNLF